MGVHVKRHPSTARLSATLAATLVGSLVGALCAAAPATARTGSQASLTVRVGDFVRTSDGCRNHPVTYAARGSAPEPGTWTIQLRLFEPGATEPTSTTAYTSIGGAGAPAGTLQLQVCGKDFRPGVHDLEYRLLHGPERSRLLAGSTDLTVRAPATRTALRTTKLSGAKHRARVTVGVEKGSGYAALRGAKVRVQALTRGTWKNVKGARATTGRTGVAVITFTSPRPRAAVKVRAVTRPAPFRAGSTSPTRTIGG